MLFALISKNGSPVEKRAYSGETKDVVLKLEAEASGTPGMTFEVFVDEGDPRYKDARMPPAIPPVQDQLNAIWQGGDAMEAMRAKVLAAISPGTPPAPAKAPGAT